MEQLSSEKHSLRTEESQLFTSLSQNQLYSQIEKNFRTIFHDQSMIKNSLIILNSRFRKEVLSYGIGSTYNMTVKRVELTAYRLCSVVVKVYSVNL